MIPVENWIDRCEDGNKRMRKLSDINGIAIHRIDVGENAAAICEALKNEPGVRGMAYTFVITRSGSIQQAKPLTVVTPHSGEWNHSVIGVGLIGDFRKASPTGPQVAAAVNLCAFFVTFYREFSIGNIKGHMERPRASKDTTKECPGRMLSMPQFRTMVGERVKTVSMAETALRGIVA